ncbi:MAG: hypothetical protein FD163_1007 [Hyphomonadaceae bacterium]|nr:MAG: hypothetical protein FD128_1642 [Hyphomonadaceae bacterium]KAF0186339.1 MAG: hypothetical protein FD163_1007 [Hyphomonadaceae bacterium]
MTFSKPFIIGAAIATLIQSTCFAQNYHGQFARNEVSAGVFFRYSPSMRGIPAANTTYGLGVYQSNPIGDNNLRPTNIASPTQFGLEYRLDDAHRGAWLRGASLNASSEVRLNAQTREAYGLRNSEGGGNTLLIVAGVVAVVALAAALARDSSPLYCSGNTIPNPISGRCDPLVL